MCLSDIAGVRGARVGGGAWRGVHSWGRNCGHPGMERCMGPTALVLVFMQTLLRGGAFVTTLPLTSGKDRSSCAKGCTEMISYPGRDFV